MRFKDIQGNESLKDVLRKDIKLNRVSHAQIFLGNKGNAKLALALAYSQYLNCTQKEEEDSCDKCESCIKYKNLSHPDLHFIYPVIKNNTQKKAISQTYLSEWRSAISNNPYLSLDDWLRKIVQDNKTGKKGVIYKDEADSVHKTLRLKKYESKYRVFLVWMPEQMNLESSNKLLKVLEEPPEGTVFLFVSENIDPMISTIKSRLQKLKIPDFKEKDIKAYLSEKNISENKVRQLSYVTNNNLGEIIKLIDDEEEEMDFFKEFSSWMRFIYKEDILSISQWVEESCKKGKRLQRLFLIYAINIIRECILFSTGNTQLLRSTEKEQEFIRKFSPFVHGKNSVLLFEKLESAIKLLDRNANLKIHLFNLSIQMARLVKTKM